MISTIRIYVPAAEAKPGPPLAPILGQHQVNLIEFCKEFNKRTVQWAPSVPLMVKVLKDETNKFVLTIRPPSSKFFIDQIVDANSNTVEATALYDAIKFRSAASNHSLKSTAKMFFGFLSSKKRPRLLF